MATAQESGSGGLASSVASARDFVRERLREADSPMSPSELAEEYGCSNAHVSNICSELNQSGEIERVETGRYVDVPGPATEADAPSPEQSESESEVAAEAETEPADEEAEGAAGSDSDPSAGGGPPSADLATEAGDGPSDRDAALAAAGTSAAAALPVALEELDARQWAMIGAGALVVYLVFIRDGSGDGSESEPAAGGGEPTAGPDGGATGGLVGADEEDEQDAETGFQPWGGE